MKDSTVTCLNTYRDFRSSIIESLPPEDRRPWSQERLHPLRLLVVRYREHLAEHGEQMLTHRPEVEPFLRKALCIPGGIQLVSTRVERVSQCLTVFMPLAYGVQRAKTLLLPIGTHEGRGFIFKQHIKRALPGRLYFDAALDFALRNLQSAGGFEAIERAARVNLGWMQACLRLGIHRMNEVARVYDSKTGRPLDGRLVLALVKRGVVNSAEALAQLPKARTHDEPLTTADIHRFHQVVQIMQDAGVDFSLIPQLARFSVNRFDIQRLSSTLSVLGMQGSELSALLDLVGESLLLVKPERWDLLRNSLGVHRAADLGRFKKLLDAWHTPNREFILALRALGASVEELESCQSLINAVSERESPPPIAQLQLLFAAPHYLTFTQLAQAEDYLREGGDLQPYLQVLTLHGFGEAQSLLAFQCCYRQLHSNTLRDWLEIARGRVGGEPAEAIAKWILQVGRGEGIDGFAYLKQAGEIHTLQHLNQAMNLARLGSTLLRYVREERGVTGLGRLLQWYRHESKGVTKVRRWAELDATSRVLLGDAFDRQDFQLLEGNQASVEYLITKRIETELGVFPYRADEETRAIYSTNSSKLRKQMRVEWAPQFGALLKRTSGLIPRALVEHIDGPAEELQCRIDEMTPLLADLLVGKGPTQDTLTDLDVDLIGLVYRVTASDVRQSWAKVVGREADVSARMQDTQYPMHWARTEQHLQGKIDDVGIEALLAARQFAKHFDSYYQTDMHQACRQLSPKRSHDPAAEVASLAAHLGVLLAVASSDLNMEPWLEHEFEALRLAAENKDFVHEKFQSLLALFDVQLGDALDALETGFVEGLTVQGAGKLASRLDRRFAPDSFTAKEDLKQALAKTREAVLRVYLRWAKRQLDQFKAKGVGEQCTPLYAVLSKAPAAYFARHAAGLCTHNNTDMWQESRYAHLLAFECGGKSLAGMAMLYFERIPNIDAKRDSLIIRAINPMKDLLSSHDISSVVDSFFAVAIRIAQENNLAAVAFPSPAGMHLMSNIFEVESNITERFSKCACSLGRGEANEDWYAQPRQVKANFYAYETGQTLVQDLYAIWRSSEADASKSAGLDEYPYDWSDTDLRPSP